MSVKDEFTTLPPEDIIPPEDYGYRKKEENFSPQPKAIGNSTEESVKKEKQKRNTLMKMFAGAVMSVAVIKAVEGDDIFYRTHEVESYVSSASEYVFELAQTAYRIDDDSICLTENGKRNSVGSVRSIEPVDISKGVEISFSLLQSEYRGSSSGKGGDGISVSFSRGIDDNPGTGGYLGYNGNFGVEFDLFGNPPKESVGGEDYPGDHIAIIGDSVWHAYSHTGAMNLDDNNVHSVRLVYENETVTVYYDGDKKLESKVDGAEDLMYISIAGACGDGTAYQTISNIQLNGKKVLIVGEIANNQQYREEKEDTEAGGDITTEMNSDSEDTADEKEPDTDNLKDSNDANEAENLDQNTNEDTADTDNSALTTVCSNCNGYGIICPGSVEADDPEGCHGAEIVSCKACNGTGREANGRLCNWCNGTLKHRCPSWEYHYECPVCEGKGEIELH